MIVALLAPVRARRDLSRACDYRPGPALFTALMFVVGCGMGIGKASVYKYVPDYSPTTSGPWAGWSGRSGRSAGSSSRRCSAPRPGDRVAPDGVRRPAGPDGGEPGLAPRRSSWRSRRGSGSRRGESCPRRRRPDRDLRPPGPPATPRVDRPGSIRGRPTGCTRRRSGRGAWSRRGRRRCERIVRRVGRRLGLDRRWRARRSPAGSRGGRAGPG